MRASVREQKKEFGRTLEELRKRRSEKGNGEMFAEIFSRTFTYRYKIENATWQRSQNNFVTFYIQIGISNFINSGT